MRRAILWIGGARGFTVVGFAVMLAGMLWFAATAPPTTMSSSAAFAQDKAQTFTSSDRFPFSGTLGFYSCTGELVRVQGTLHTVEHTTIDAKGVWHTKFHDNLQGKGESASGAKYVFHETWNYHQNRSGTPPFNFTYTKTFLLIRRGSATLTDDMKVKVLVHQTINANGELTSQVYKAESVCK